MCLVFSQFILLDNTAAAVVAASRSLSAALTVRARPGLSFHPRPVIYLVGVAKIETRQVRHYTQIDTAVVINQAHQARVLSVDVNRIARGRSTRLLILLSLQYDTPVKIVCLEVRVGASVSSGSYRRYDSASRDWHLFPAPAYKYIVGQAVVSSVCAGELVSVALFCIY